MKRYRNIIILFIVFVVLAAGVFILKNVNGNTPAPTTTQSPLIELFVSDDESIKSFEILGGKRDYTFEQTSSGTWELTNPKFDLDAMAMISLVYQVENVYALQEVAGPGYKPEEYGLDTPVTLKINMADKSRVEFYYGSKAPNGSGFYVAKKGTDKVYLVETNKVQPILSDLKDKINKTIIDIGENGLTGLKLHKNGKLIFDIDEGEKKVWDIIAPIHCGSRSDLIEQLIPLLSKLVVQEYAAVNVKNFKKYGLDKPSYAFEVRSRTQKNITIQLGKTVSGGGRYAVKKGDDKVFIVNPADLPFLDRPLKDMMEPFVALQQINDVKKLDVTFEGKTDVSDLEIKEVNKKEVETFIFNGKDVSFLTNDKTESLFKNYYASLTGIKWYEYDLNVHPKYANPILTIQYTKNDNKQYEISYVPKNKDYCYAFKDKVFTGLIVDREELSAIRTAKKALQDEIARRKI